MKHVRRSAISTTSRNDLSKFFFLQGKAPNEIHAILSETLGGNAPSYVTVKNWMTQFKRGDFFHMCCASSWTTQNSDHPGDY
jgi:ABC-type dipeptide/oligopeptide/nickel transport system permease component